MLKAYSEKSDGKVIILDIICFEYLILAFEKLVQWTGSGNEKIKTLIMSDGVKKVLNQIA